MKSRIPLLLPVLLLIQTLVTAQQAPKHTDEILQEARQQAASQKKKVFVIFHASWCGWCHKMDTSMNDPSVKAFFAKNYVVRHLVVQEAKDKKNLENPGATELLKKYNGNDQGIPYWLIFDKDGKLLADSKIRPAGAGLDAPGKNTGCPATQEEVTHFIEVLKKTSGLKDTELTLIEQRFRKNEQKR